MEELAKCLKKLQSLDLVTRSDEVALARRRYQHLVGLSSGGRKRVEKIESCWRDGVSERKQAEFTLKNVVLRLQRLRRECWVARVEARAKLSPHQYGLM